MTKKVDTEVYEGEEDILELDDESSVEDGMDALIGVINKAIDCVAWLPANNENVYAIHESLSNALEIIQWIQEKMGDVHFELDFRQRLH